MEKGIVMMGMFFGSLIGGYLPTLFGADALSFTSVFFGFIGGILGIWLSYQLVER
jgi:uncharacterized membrane protein YeaQ/YmgE (transglycosylase-associated protein family)